MDYIAHDEALPLHDKEQHAWAGAAIGETLSQYRENRGAAYVRIALAAIGKEVADSKSPDTHDADPFDAASTMLAGIATYEGWHVIPVLDRTGGAIIVRCSW